eukprot:TRINITY_DN5202_c0_g1_i1.p3 TRINITY_DN5202_c0_g1~~TRINITY_DN5202_c0_g1_i1.p3  ORF type:complete len:51 (-),score=10.79 TRINITY_DN5202_c0_g1_i1:138-290(-)
MIKISRTVKYVCYVENQTEYQCFALQSIHQFDSTIREFELKMESCVMMSQ